MFFKKKHNPENPFNVDIILILVLFGVAIISSFFLWRPTKESTTESSPTALASLIEINQEVRLRRRADFRWKDVGPGEKLGVKDRVFTGKESLAKISLFENRVDLLENSLLEITADVDHDIKLEYGFLKITFSDRPLRLKFKNKIYEISGTKGKVLELKAREEHVDFFGEKNAFNISVKGENGAVVIRQANRLNSDLCSGSTKKEFLRRDELCPSCAQESELLSWNEKQEDFITNNLAEIKLIRGENKFRLKGNEETCVVFRQLDLIPPQFKKWENKVLLSHTTGSANLNFSLVNFKENLGGHFKIELSKDEDFKPLQIETSQSGDFKIKIVQAGVYKIRGQYCLEANDCSKYSSTQNLRVELPPILEAPQLKKSYRLKASPILPRSPDQLEILSFDPIPGAKTYGIEIIRSHDGKKIYVQNTIHPEIQLPELEAGSYLLSITPIDAWARSGKKATSELLVEKVESLPVIGDQKTAKQFNHSLAFFGGLQLIQMNQWKSSASATGATYNPVSGGLNYEFYQKEWVGVLGHNFYTLNADSNNKNRSKLLHETSLGMEKNNYYFGISRIDLPYFAAESGDFSIKSHALWLAELGVEFKEIIPKLEISTRLRKSVIKTGDVNESYGALLKLEHRTLLLKNQLTWYNGLDLYFQFSKFSIRDSQTENLIMREFIKTGLLFEF
jgi:hypothetical protein